jgi:hypothetical protein
MNSPQQDELIEQTEAQRNPGLADPSDFKVSTGNSAEVPGHGQRGDSVTEFKKLLAVRASKAGKSKPTNRGLSGTRNTQPAR